MSEPLVILSSFQICLIAGGERMDESDKESRQELIKHSAAIQIENNLTLLQRCTWNVLLYNKPGHGPLYMSSDLI